MQLYFEGVYMCILIVAIAVVLTVMAIKFNLI